MAALRRGQRKIKSHPEAHNLLEVGLGYMGFYLNQTADVSLLTTRPQLFWPLLLLLTTELMWGKLYRTENMERKDYYQLYSWH